MCEKSDEDDGNSVLLIMNQKIGDRQREKRISCSQQKEG